MDIKEPLQQTVELNDEEDQELEEGQALYEMDKDNSI